MYRKLLLEAYVDKVFGGITFLIALGSLAGILGCIVSALGLFFGPDRYKARFAGTLCISFMLMAVCGGSYFGVRYFRLNA